MIALPPPEHSPLARNMHALDQMQWWTTQQLENYQLAQLKVLLTYFYEQSDWVARRLVATGKRIEDLTASMDALRTLPLTQRRDYQDADEFFHARQVPQDHMPVSSRKSSGSTGQPVELFRSAGCGHAWQAVAMRDHLWHERDFKGRFAVVRPAIGKPVSQKTWGPPVDLIYESGSSYAMDVTTDIAVLVDWLHEVNPHYLLIYPIVLRSVLEHPRFEAKRLTHIKQVRTISENAPPALRENVKEVLNVPMVDIYSSEETGTIAMQCPVSGLYHTMDEMLITEVIRDDGSVCAEGEVGRVVVTDLCNLASPVIRYANMDYAERGPTCPCGRGLKTLRRILGRERNMLKLPDGRSHWPTTGYRDYHQVADVLQFQVIQKAMHSLEVRLVVRSGKLSMEQEKAMTDIICRWLSHPFECQYQYFDLQIPRSTSGKFEEFICEIS